MNRVLPVVLVGSALVFAGCGSSSSSSSSSASSSAAAPATAATSAAAAASGAVQSGLVNVKYQNIAINPANITVKVGTTIKWTNYDTGVNHNVTALSGPASFHSADFTGGGTFEYTVTKPGVIKYQCTIHPASMNGTITVVK